MIIGDLRTLGSIRLEFAPLELLPLAIPMLAYARRARRLESLGRPVPIWRQACFGSGLLLVALTLIALGPPSDELLYAHMIEHLLIGDLAAILLVLGLTGPMLRPILAIKPLEPLRLLVHPKVALPLWALDLFAWHSPALYQETLRSDPVHALEHMMFIFFGCLMWMPVIGPLPKPSWFGPGAKVLYVAGVRLVTAALGNAFIWAGTAFYPVYAAGEQAHGISPLDDQGIAGAIMLGEGMVVTLAVLAWAILRWASESEQRQRVLDLADRHGIELSEARARRAVAAGRAEELERRMRNGRVSGV